MPGAHSPNADSSNQLFIKEAFWPVSAPHCSISLVHSGDSIQSTARDDCQAHMRLDCLDLSHVRHMHHPHEAWTTYMGGDRTHLLLWPAQVHSGVCF